jgi:ubiquinone/menaquinone biosynthesis C-methylase UbiE/DNA-binding transcriptional ArsR family regulator
MRSRKVLLMVSSHTLVTALKAAAEPTRLRILALLASDELNVKDLTRILGQSQPRLSRHLKLLSEAGLVERAREGSWVYFRLPLSADNLAHTLLRDLDGADPVLLRDRQRVETVKRERETMAQDYFQKHASNWDQIRTLHVAEAEVEAAMRNSLADTPIDLLVDVGTGTGRILELFADRYRRGLGFDLSTAMLAYARPKLAAAGIHHANVRQGDIYHLPLADGTAGAVVMHQILHYLSDPARAVTEAARLVAPNGRLLIVDFAPHDNDFLRETQRHERLGFETATVSQWLSDAGLTVTETRALPPTHRDGEAQLTVSLWRAERVPAANLISPKLPKAAPKSKLERTA